MAVFRNGAVSRYTKVYKKVVVQKFKTPANGFALIDLIVSIAIAAIVVTLAVTNFVEVVQPSRLTSNTNDIDAAFNLVGRTRRTMMCCPNNRS